MKKNLILFCFLKAIFFPAMAAAQEWELVKPDSKVFFTNKQGYLRGMRIDSTVYEGDTTIYYPFRTARMTWGDFGGQADTNGGSWWGKEIISYQNIVTIANQQGLPAVIHTRSSPGDIWTFFGDEQAIHYEAEVTGADTLTVMGMLDSVKTIRLYCLDGAGNIIADSVNGMELVLSKHNGLVCALDFYLFPYRDTTGTYSERDCYYFESSWNGGGWTINGGSPGGLLFRQVDFYPPDASRVYDFQQGNILDTRSTTRSWPDAYTTERRTSVITGKMVTDTMISYTYDYNGSITVYTGNSAPVTTYGSGFDTWNISIGILADTSYMPEERNNEGYHCYYFQEDTSYCLSSPRWLYRKDKIINGRFQSGPEWEFHRVGYKEGLGEWDYNSGGFLRYYPIYERGLLAAKKNEHYCQVNNVLDIGERNRVQAGVNIQVYPNPARGTFRLDAGSSRIVSLQVFDLAGKLLLTRAFTGKNSSESVDVYGIAPGIYLLKVNTGNAAGYTKLVVR